MPPIERRRRGPKTPSDVVMLGKIVGEVVQQL